MNVSTTYKTKARSRHSLLSTFQPRFPREQVEEHGQKKGRFRNHPFELTVVIVVGCRDILAGKAVVTVGHRQCRFPDFFVSDDNALDFVLALAFRLGFPGGAAREYHRCFVGQKGLFCVMKVHVTLRSHLDRQEGMTIVG